MGIEEDLLSIFRGEAVALRNGIDIKSETEMDFVPMTKVNMCYICGAVVFDEKGDVLLIQEAKKSCRGSWYLPAGRLEQGETIIDGTKREVKEEAGFDCDLTTLLSVEINNHTWIRFMFLAKITGGKLKTLAEQDAESLQAKFFSQQDIAMSKSSLRHGDILKIIDLGRKYLHADPSSRSPNMVPVIAPHTRLVHRVVIVDRSPSSEEPMHVLACTKNGDHIPTALINHISRQGSIAVSVYAILRDAFATSTPSSSVRMCGILGVEHRGTREKEDGVCVTSLVSFDLSPKVSPPAMVSDSFKWCPLENGDIQTWLGDGTKGKVTPLL